MPRQRPPRYRPFVPPIAPEPFAGVVRAADTVAGVPVGAGLGIMNWFGKTGAIFDSYARRGKPGWGAAAAALSFITGDGLIDGAMNGLNYGAVNGTRRTFHDLDAITNSDSNYYPGWGHGELGNGTLGRVLGAPVGAISALAGHFSRVKDVPSFLNALLSSPYAILDGMWRAFSGGAKAGLDSYQAHRDGEDTGSTFAGIFGAAMGLIYGPFLGPEKIMRWLDKHLGRTEAPEFGKVTLGEALMAAFKIGIALAVGIPAGLILGPLRGYDIGKTQGSRGLADFSRQILRQGTANPDVPVGSGQHSRPVQEALDENAHDLDSYQPDRPDIKPAPPVHPGMNRPAPASYQAWQAARAAAGLPANRAAYVQELKDEANADAKHVVPRPYRGG